MSTTTTVRFPTLEAAVSALCQKAFGAALSIHPTPDPTYRVLAVGEVIEAGDEYVCNFGRNPAMNVGGVVDALSVGNYRRLVSPPTKPRTYETETDLDTLRRQRDAWQETAAQHLRNEQYYRGLLIQCGEAIGKEAYTADDGTTQEDVLCAKIPELVRARTAKLLEQEEQISMLEHRNPDMEHFISELRRTASQTLFNLNDDAFSRQQDIARLKAEAVTQKQELVNLRAIHSRLVNMLGSDDIVTAVHCLIVKDEDLGIQHLVFTEEDLKGNALTEATDLLASIMRDEVNHQDEAEKWLRAYAPRMLRSDVQPRRPVA